jgi:hypothetical protein
VAAIKIAFEAASSAAREHGMSLDETLQFIADYLIRHAISGSHRIRGSWIRCLLSVTT